MSRDGGRLLLALPVTALLLLAAHFLHAGLWPMAAACLAAVGLLWVRQPWAARTLQVLLAAGAIEWVLTLVLLAQMRMAHQQPYLRLVLILGAVAALTMCAAVAFQAPAMARRFGFGGAQEPAATDA